MTPDNSDATDKPVTTEVAASEETSTEAAAPGEGEEVEMPQLSRAQRRAMQFNKSVKNNIANMHQEGGKAAGGPAGGANSSRMARMTTKRASRGT